MEVSKSEHNLKLHLKIIYTFLVINISLCTFCLYLLFSRQTEISEHSGIKTISDGKYNITAELLQREKRGTHSSFPRLVSVFFSFFFLNINLKSNIV